LDNLTEQSVRFVTAVPSLTIGHQFDTESHSADLMNLDKRGIHASHRI